MNDRNHSIVVGPADQALAAEFAQRSTVGAINPALDADDFNAAAGNRTSRITIGNGASIDVSVKEPARELMLGETDGAQAIVSTELDGMARRADHLIEQMNLMVDKQTGQPRPHLVPEYNRLSLQVQQLQYSAAYQQEYAVKALREQSNKTRGIEQLQREADEYDRRSQDATSREFDRQFGRVRIV